MIKYRENNNNFKIFAFCVSALLVSSFLGHIMLYGEPTIHTTNVLYAEKSIVPLGDGSTFIWEDDFEDTSKINTSSTKNCSIDIFSGTVSMQNTYIAWETYPEWTRLKSISIINDGEEEFDNYVIELTIAYDGDMQPDFDDLRFTNASGSVLSYWIGERTAQDAQVFVRISFIPASTTIPIYMFYGNPEADDESDENIFSWQEITDEDIRIVYTAALEGAWYPDVAYGAEHFLIAWEEGEGPKFDPEYAHRLIHRQIHVRLLDTNGQNPIPPYPSDIDISTTPSNPNHHAEKPSIAYSSDSEYFLIVWEENPISSRYRISIKGALVTTEGVDYSPFLICEPAGGPIIWYPCNDPAVAYDEQSDRFFVVWARSDTSGDYDLYGRLYSSVGIPIGSQLTLASTSLYQGQPAICSDNQGHFLVVYEEGTSSVNGPFSLKARLYDSNGDPIGGTKLIASGTTDLDNIYPSVTYNNPAERYFVSWNTGDISDGDNNGAIKGKILDENAVVLQGVTIEDASNLKGSDVISHLGSMFFITYDDNFMDTDKIWGKFVTADGIVMQGKQELSDIIDCNKEYTGIASAGDNIFVAWEDDRLELHLPEARGSVWNCLQTTDSSNISYLFGNEKNRILEAVLVSLPISPEDFVEWIEFHEISNVPQNTFLNFDILDETGTIPLLEDISNGEDISSIIDPVITLRARFLRTSPKDTPILDWWSVNATIGSDIEPPWTMAEFNPSEPNGDNEWYITPIEINFTAFDNDSPPENITTYYCINQGETEEYIPESIIVLSTEQYNNSIEYWSIDNANNEELPHNIVDNLHIDLSPPFVELREPTELVFAGNVKINGSATEYASGSGIDKLIIRINNEIVFNESYDGVYTAWFEWNFSVEYGETYDIHIEVFDKAGLKGDDRRTVVCSERGIYSTGYIYFFNNPKIGPVSLLQVLDLSILFDYTSLYIVVPEFHENVSSAKFVARQILLNNKFEQWDDNVSDGCVTELDLPLGLYEIKVFLYNEEEQLLEEILLIPRLVVILI